MPKYQNALPEAGVASYLAVPDIAKSIQYYRDVFGFHVEMVDSGFALLSRDRATIMLQQHVDPPKRRARCAAYIWVKDLESSIESFKSHAVKITQSTTAMPWGTKEFQVEDPDGYQLRFAQIAAIE